MTAEQPGRPTRVPSVDRAVGVLDLVAREHGSGLTLAALTRGLGLPKSTILGVCQSLVAERLLARGADGTYRLGPAVVELAAARQQQGVTVQRIGIALPDLTNTFYRAELEAARQEADVVGATLEHRSAEQSLDRQAAQIAELVAAGAELVVVDPIATRGLEDVLAHAHAQGATVVAVNGATFGSDATVVTDNAHAGALAGRHLTDRLGPRASVAVIGGLALTAITDRIGGFRGALAERPDIAVVAEYGGDHSRESGRAAARALLRDHPGIDAVFAINDPEALGVADVLRGTGTAPLVVSVDGSAEAVARIAAGDILSATAAQDPRRLARTAVQTGLGVANGSTAPGRSLTLPTRLVTRDDAAHYETWETR